MSNKDKRKGEYLLKKGCVLADTSNQTKNFDEKSILGVASKKGINITIMIEASKKEEISKLLEKNKKLKPNIPEIIQSVKLFYALNSIIDTIPAIYICADGLDRGKLKHYLQRFLNNKFDNNKINIMRSLKKIFGKKNIAHNLALKVKQKIITPSLKLDKSHFKKLKLIE